MHNLSGTAISTDGDDRGTVILDETCRYDIFQPPSGTYSTWLLPAVTGR